MSGITLVLLAATLGILYALPNILQREVPLFSQFKLAKYFYLSALAIIALIGIVRIIEMKVREKNPLVFDKAADEAEEGAPDIDTDKELALETTAELTEEEGLELVDEIITKFKQLNEEQQQSVLAGIRQRV
jgi:hypothetical protein